MTLLPESVKWAVNSIHAHSDGDLFPRIDEIAAIKARCDEFASAISNKPLSNFPPGPHRRFIVPKDEISYRQATQLEPQDSIILSAIMHQFGGGIEARRRAKNQVFSYRFAPTAENGFYGSQNGWNNFWEKAKAVGGSAGAILYCDISDFYNQVYHHTVENQLYESGFPNQAVKWIIALIESTTAGVSRGVPIGPHAAHLIAEASLIPIDNAMDAQGVRFLRYADDIIVFGDSMKTVKRDLSIMASVLDKQQRLTLQRHKTRFYSRGEFRRYCQSMMEDRSISEDEESILDIVDKYSEHNPYKMISYNDIADEDWEALSDELISGVIEEYLDDLEPDYIRLRWFYRRLAQIGHPGALNITLERMDALTPCFANVCLYISRIQNLTDEQWKDSGGALLELLD